VLDPRLDVPYPELISMARAFAERTEGDEQAELLHLAERLTLARDGLEFPSVDSDSDVKEDP
ncbi:MAG: hypothetical protein GY711_13365, partial [bacterium]|nr:hypothetical protein [bacterium]